VKSKKLLSAVEDGTHNAVEYLTPYVEQALRDGGEFADQTYARVRPVLKDARIFGARLAADTFDKVHPVIDDALDRVSPAVDATVKRVKPAVDDVLQRIPPTVDHAREIVQEDYLPKIADLLSELARQPLARELKIAAATAAISKEIRKAAKPKRSGWKTFGKILLAGAALGAVAVAIRKLLADPSTGWESHVPSTAYVADPVNDVVDDVKKKVADTAKDVSEKVEDAAAKAADVVEDVKDNVTEAADDVAEGVKLVKGDIEEKLDQLADEVEGGDASPLADSPYGTGSYVGDEPPEGFTIKGNDRSMKYHVPGSAAYERTIAEVWFETEDAAREAGFVRAQR
jgi:gas vesicle protein